MRLFCAVVLAAIALQGAAAEECNTFTSELWPPGVRTVVFDEEGRAILTDRERKTADRYATAGSGTGIPSRSMLPIDGTEGDGHQYIEHKGDMIIGYEVFTPYCP